MVGDITQNATTPRPDGFVATADKQAVLDVTLGASRMEIPNLPQADNSRPRVQVGTGSGAVGSVVALPVSLVQVPVAAQKVVVRIAFDDTALTFVRARRSDLAAGFDDINVTRSIDGLAILEMTVLLRSQHGADGQLNQIEFSLLPSAAGRTLRIDVIGLSVDDGRYTLGQTPVSGPDAADGTITVSAPALPAMLAAVAEEGPSTPFKAAVTSTAYVPLELAPAPIPSAPEPEPKDTVATVPELVSVVAEVPAGHALSAVIVEAAAPVVSVAVVPEMPATPFMPAVETEKPLEPFVQPLIRIDMTPSANIENANPLLGQGRQRRWLMDAVLPQDYQLQRRTAFATEARTLAANRIEKMVSAMSLLK